MRFSQLFLIALTLSILASPAHAQGVKVVNSCTSLQAAAPIQVALTITRAVDYSSRKGSISVDYSGSIKWDANPYSLKGSFTTDLPVGSAPVPRLPNEYQITDGSNSISSVSIENALSEKSSPKTPFPGFLIVLKAPAFNGQYVLLKLTMSPERGPKASFGSLYITDSSGDQVTTPDRGPYLSLSCTETVHDN